MSERVAEAESTGSEGGSVFAVSLPPAMCARDILANRAYAEAMGYGWLHDPEQETEFVRTFREQVKRQAEIYEAWLQGEAPVAAPGESNDV